MELTDILKCPKTGKKLCFDHVDSIVRVEGSDITYPITDQTIDFIPEARDKISTSYDKIAPRYDAILAHPKLFQRICNRIIWGHGDDNAYANEVTIHPSPGHPVPQNGLYPNMALDWTINVYRPKRLVAFQF